MQRRLQDRNTVVLEHVEQRRLSGIVETEEQQLGVLVEQAERRQDVVDWKIAVSGFPCSSARTVLPPGALLASQKAATRQSTQSQNGVLSRPNMTWTMLIGITNEKTQELHTPVNDPHDVRR